MKSAISSAIAIPTLPSSTSVGDRLKYLAAMALIGTNRGGSVSAWKVYILAYTVMLFPRIEQSLPREIYSPVPIPQETITATLQAFSGILSIPEDYDEEDLHQAERVMNTTRIGPGLPLPDPDCMSRYLSNEAAPKVIASHYSILLFIAGKRIEGDDHSALTQNRPQALIKKAHLPADPELLIGCLRFSDEAHLLLNSAWQELAALRGIVFPTFAEFSSEATDEVQDLIYTTMHLLRYSGMQHAKIVHGFLGAYPWARDVPQLRTSIAKFDESIIAAAGYPSKIQPYVKLIYGDKTEIFPRKEMEVLISCAVASMADTSPDIVNFYNSDAFTPIVDAFLAERDRRGDVRKLNLLVTEADLKKRLVSGGVILQTEEQSEEEFYEDPEEYNQVEAPTREEASGQT